MIFFLCELAKAVTCKKSMLGQKKKKKFNKYYMQQFFDKYVEKIIIIRVGQLIFLSVLDAYFLSRGLRSNSEEYLYLMIGFDL